MGTEIVSTSEAMGTVVAGVDLGDPALAEVVRGGLAEVESLLVE